MTITAKFGAAVKEKRINKCLTQEDLAKKAGITREHLAKIEAGSYFKAIKNDTADAIARALGCTVDVLLK